MCSSDLRRLMRVSGRLLARRPRLRSAFARRGRSIEEHWIEGRLSSLRTRQIRSWRGQSLADPTERLLDEMVAGGSSARGEHNSDDGGGCCPGSGSRQRSRTSAAVRGYRRLNRAGLLTGHLPLARRQAPRQPAGSPPRSVMAGCPARGCCLRRPGSPRHRAGDGPPGGCTW